VLVRCPGCDNLHLVADRLGYFEDASTDMEALARQAGDVVRKGALRGGGGSGGSGGGGGGGAADGVEVSAGAARGHALGSVLAAPPLGGGGSDGVIELTEDDLRVLASGSKSVSLRTRLEVVDKLEYRAARAEGAAQAAEGGAAAAPVAGAAAAAQ
jgi:hypothetical protein